MSALLRPAFVLLLLALTVTAVPAEEQRYSAAELVQLGQKAVTAALDAAQEDPALDLTRSRTKPFWEAIKQLSESLQDASQALDGQDDALFTALATAMGASQQARIALVMLQDVSDPARDSMDGLYDIVSTLNDNFSKEAARLADGDELTDEERRQLDELKARQDELLEKLDKIENTVAANNEAMKKNLDEIRRNSQRIRDARYHPRDFCHAMFASRFILGSVWGWHFWWGPWGYWGPGYVDVNIHLWDDWTDSYAYDWALASETVAAAEILEDGATIEYLDALETIDPAQITDTESWLEEAQTGLQESDLLDLTVDIEAGGWDDVSTDLGREVMDGTMDNFDHSPFDGGHEMDVFPDMGGFDDFGGGFDF